MRVDTAFYLDENAHIHVIGAGTDRAFLSIDHGEVSVVISPRADVRLTTKDVEREAGYSANSIRIMRTVLRKALGQAE